MESEKLNEKTGIGTTPHGQPLGVLYLKLIRLQGMPRAALNDPAASKTSVIVSVSTERVRP